MSKIYTTAFLRDEVARLIAPTIETRRAALLSRRDIDYKPDSRPVEADDIDDFILNCWILEEPFIGMLLDEDGTCLEIEDEEFEDFLESVESWTDNQTWLAGDGGVLTDDGEDIPMLLAIGNVPQRKINPSIIYKGQIRYDHLELSEKTTQQISLLAPHLGILQKLAEKAIDIDSLHWRELEELVAELLERDNYEVQLGKGTKDGGADIIAIKEIENVGFFKSIWQAKKKKSGVPVGISTIRELADTRREMKATKAVIVTTSFLTRGAIERVKRDKYELGKIEKPDLERWIDRVLKGR
ncbi:MAG TPA: restriction endonuclease [Phormidium sp.]